MLQYYALISLNITGPCYSHRPKFHTSSEYMQFRIFRKYRKLFLILIPVEAGVFPLLGSA